MKPAHILMTLLVLANVLLWAIGFTLYDRPDAQSVCLVGVSMAQAGLLSIWLGFGRAPASRRLAVVSVIVLLFHGIARTWRPELAGICAHFALGIIYVSVPFLAMRLFGVQIIHLEDSESAPDAATREPKFQFSLRAMFLWTTVAAILLSALATTGFHRIAGAVLDVNWSVPFVLVPSLFFTVLSLWAVLGMRKVKPRIFVFALFLCLLCWMVLEIGWRTPTSVFLPQNTVLLFSLAVCRVAGYRIVWKSRRVHRDAA